MEGQSRRNWNIGAGGRENMPGKSFNEGTDTWEATLA